MSNDDLNTSKVDAEEASGDEYFSSYADLSVHELMLKDKPRTLAYKTFIEKNPDLFRDKIVIDVGAGTGILSLFAARAGAKQVYAIEASSLSEVCRQIVQCNGLADKITVIHGRVEDVSLPPGLQADVLLSEWMGFYLLHESMLNSVIFARDKWLSSDGVMVPSSATLYLCPVSMKDYHRENVGFWRDVYGFDYEPFQALVVQNMQSQPVITTVKTDQCLACAEQVVRLDLKYVDAEDVRKIPGRFRFELQKYAILHGFACWFDVNFQGDVDVTLDTGPEAPATHWQQTIMLLPGALMVNKGETLACSVSLTQDATNPRRYNICIEVDDEEDYEAEDKPTPDSDVTMEARDLIQEAIASHTASKQ